MRSGNNVRLACIAISATERGCPTGFLTVCGLIRNDAR
jgi:hypothetical protein